MRAALHREHGHERGAEAPDEVQVARARHLAEAGEARTARRVLLRVLIALALGRALGKQEIVEERARRGEGLPILASELEAEQDQRACGHDQVEVGLRVHVLRVHEEHRLVDDVLVRVEEGLQVH